MNLWKYCTKLKNDCTHFAVVGTAISFKLNKFKPLMCIPSGETSNISLESFNTRLQVKMEQQDLICL